MESMFLLAVSVCRAQLACHRIVGRADASIYRLAAECVKTFVLNLACSVSWCQGLRASTYADYTHRCVCSANKRLYCCYLAIVQRHIWGSVSICWRL